MDTHSFGPPVPDPDASTQPCWKVDVLRGGDDNEDSDVKVVGTLCVSNDNLPPRRNRKGKVVWKLPETLETPPRFGVPERKRLWELFKQQKKERRRRMKEEDGKGDDDGDDKEDDISQAASRLSLDRDDQKVALIDKNGTTNARNDDSTTEASTAASNGGGEPLLLPPTPPSLPPGFETTTTAAPLRPPPGIGVPPGLAPPPPPAAADDVQSATAQPPLYFQIIPEEASIAALGALVAQTFVESVSGTNAAASLSSRDTAASSSWLRYYHPDAVQSLLVGSAQAPVCVTSEERQRQWRSLLQPGSVWECHGWTAQPVSATTTIASSSGQRAGGSGLLPHLPPSVVLVVLTGQTLQPGTGWFSFTLTLLLDHRADASAAAAASYCIVNDVLTLFALPASPAAVIKTTTGCGDT